MFLLFACASSRECQVKSSVKWRLIFFMFLIFHHSNTRSRSPLSVIACVAASESFSSTSPFSRLFAATILKYRATLHVCYIILWKWWVALWWLRQPGYRQTGEHPRCAVQYWRHNLLKFFYILAFPIWCYYTYTIPYYTNPVLCLWWKF